MTALNPDLSKPTCRVCLQNNEDEEMSSIFDIDAEFYDLHIYEKIEQCANIEILRHEEMPTLICGNCFGLLKVSYKFRTICRNSNEYLLQFVALETVSSKTQEYCQENTLPTSENISKSNLSSSEHKNESTDIPEIIKIEQINQSDSPPTSEHLFDESFDGEEWFDISYPDDDDDISCGENVDLDVKDEVNEPKKRKKKSDTEKKYTSAECSKTLEISSDGTPIIREKKTRAKRKKNEEERQICEICGNIYQRLHSLELHMKKHRDEKPFACEICGHAFPSNFQLKRHMRKHTGDRPYKCSYCPRAFGDQSTLIKHERVHRNERPFKCETCGKCFSYTGVLNYHKLVHTGEKPYACEICGKCFPRAHKLREHLKTLQHQNDPRSKILLENIRRNNETETLKVQNFTLKV